MLHDFCINNHRNWDEEISQLLFEFITTLPNDGGPTPFNIMFARNPTGIHYLLMKPIYSFNKICRLY